VEFREAIRLAGGALWANKLRSFLTVLGNVVAVLSVVALVSVIQGLNRFVSSELLQTGSSVFTVSKFGLIMDYEQFLKALQRRDITLDDALDLERKMTLAAAVVPQSSQWLPLRRASRQTESAPVLGTGADYPLVGRATAASGRDLSELDVRSRSPVAVIGDRVREKLFPNEDPLGKDIRVGGHTLTVVGVLEKRGGTTGSNADDAVLIPITTLLKNHGSRRSLEISILPAAPAATEAAREEAELLLKIRRGLKPYDDPDFGLVTDEQLYAIYENLTRAIYGLLLGVVSLSLVIGGIVIMNIMLVSVTERTREIGIRKAVGARRRDIVAQFLVESVLLAFAGGAMGVLGGIGVAMAVRGATPLPASIEPWSVLVGLALASSVGLFFGIYPAWRASRLVPVVALRYET
jgi:putative ABC transport system permease protein